MQKSLFENNCQLLLDRFHTFNYLKLTDKNFLSFLPKKKNSLSIQKWFSSLDIEKTNVLFIYGIDGVSSFRPLKRWLDKKKERAAVFIIDEKEKLASFLAEASAKEMLQHKGIYLFFLQKENLSDEISEIANKFPLGEMKFISFPGYIGKDLFSQIEKYLFRKLTLSNARYLDRFFSDFHFYNFLKNIKRFHSLSQMSKLKGAFNKIPMIICGAGPSLEKNLSSLKKLHDRSLIMAGGSAISLLSKAQVPFHFSVAVDPNFEEYKRLKQTNTFEAPFIFSLRLFSNVFACLNGPFGIMKSSIGELQEFLIDDKLQLEGEFLGEKIDEEALSVTSMCLALADFLGCNPIIFCGMDLSYKDGKRYVGNIRTEEEGKEIGEQKREDTDIFQNPITTTIKWQMETKAISSYIQKCKGIKFFNATDAGLGIKGAENTSLEKLKEKYFNRQNDLLSLVGISLQNSTFKGPIEEKVNQFFEECEKSLIICIDLIKEILKEKKGSGKRVLYEMDLEDEMAYKYFFYDWKDVTSFSLKEIEITENFQFLRSMVESYLKIVKELK